MLDLKQLLTDMVAAIIDNPNEISVVEYDEDDNIRFELSVSEDDMGKVIGKHGKNARAIRTIMKNAANSICKRVTVDIK